MRISAWTRVRTAAVLASVVFVFAVASSIEFASLASAKPGYTVFPGGRSQSFQVRASKGYTLFVRSIGRNRILVNADSREADVTYVAPADITTQSISARVPHLGWISMHFHPSGPVEPSPEPQGDCRGRRALTQSGTFKGHLHWRGETWLHLGERDPGIRLCGAFLPGRLQRRRRGSGRRRTDSPAARRTLSNGRPGC